MGFGHSPLGANKVPQSDAETQKRSKSVVEPYKLHTDVAEAADGHRQQGEEVVLRARQREMRDEQMQKFERKVVQPFGKV